MGSRLLRAGGVCAVGVLMFLAVLGAVWGQEDPGSYVRTSIALVGKLSDEELTKRYLADRAFFENPEDGVLPQGTSGLPVVREPIFKEIRINNKKEE